MASKKKVLVCFGTRPEVIKLAPVARELKRRAGFQALLCSSGQQMEMVAAALKVFEDNADVDGKIMQTSQSLATITSRAMDFFDGLFAKEKPQFVLVQGDTTTAFVAALAAFYNKIPSGHVEAGLRSGRKWEPFPEEINRHLISRVSDLHFAPTEKSKAALQKENVDSKSIFVTGNTVVDAFQWIVSKEKSAQAREIIKSARERKIVLITVHRRENVENNVDLYFRTLARLIKGHPDLYFVYPVHPRPIFGELVGKYLSGLENLTALPPVDYATMVALLDACHLAVTDSGGIQEEVMCAGKPVLILRDVTERPEVLESGNGILIGNRMDQLQGLFDDLVNPNSARYAHMSRKSGLLGDGRASERIVDAIDTFLS